VYNNGKLSASLLEKMNSSTGVILAIGEETLPWSFVQLVFQKRA
jgi:hypothetical protein